MKNNAKWWRIGDIEKTYLTNISKQTTLFLGKPKKFYTYAYRMQRNEQISKVKTRVRKLILQAQYSLKEIKLCKYKTKEMRNTQRKIKIKNNQRN